MELVVIVSQTRVDVSTALTRRRARKEPEEVSANQMQTALTQAPECRLAKSPDGGQLPRH